MIERDIPNENVEEQEIAQGQDGDSSQQEASSPSAETLEQLKAENTQLFSRLQRLQADFDNYRKRVKREKQEWTAQAVCELVRELLPVIDNLERASVADGSIETLASGIELVHKQFLNVLEKQGLCTIEACGTEFDPNCHHAVIQVECEEPENTVVEEMQKGYRLHERVLRPSMVKVAK
ncbi:MAG: nucleotide exchange factor GrpE [Clostridiales bacterium]|jgi:molecular chaperone GrpE|nr:nucleotide exchange factor GrpE [Clostridiales bacterium]